MNISRIICNLFIFFLFNSYTLCIKHPFVYASTATPYKKLYVSPLEKFRYVQDCPQHKSNLTDLDAKLDGSPAGNATIQNSYGGLSDGSLVEVPKSSQWNGAIATPDPNKHVTWLFDGAIGGYYSPPAGDGDISISLGGGLNVQRRDVNTRSFGYPASYFYWNEDGKYTGPYSGNYNQNSAALFRAISGPTSAGNTSAAGFSIESYGMNGAASYDVALPVSVAKYGNNATWGIISSLQDFSAHSPGAFASWNEYDMEANGQDVKYWDPKYGIPQAGSRSLFMVSAKTHAFGGWPASTTLTLPVSGLAKLPKPVAIVANGDDGGLYGHYVWVLSKSGTTGSSSPSFPTPARFVGSVSKGVLTVTSVSSGSIAAGNYVSVGWTSTQISSQLSGTAGGVGTYAVNDSTVSIGAGTALYAAPEITDGTAAWRFGTEYEQTVSSVLWLGGNSTYDTVLGLDTAASVSGAVIDTTLGSYGSTAAGLRVKAGQTAVDFTGNGTLAGRNQHALSYSDGSVHYNVGGNYVFGIRDSGVPIGSFETISGTGSTVADAAQTTSAVSAVTFTASTQGVLVSQDTGQPGARQEIMNVGSVSGMVYPLSATWNFNGRSAGAGILLPPQASLTVIRYDNKHATVFAEYHPPAP